MLIAVPGIILAQSDSLVVVPSDTVVSDSLSVSSNDSIDFLKDSIVIPAQSESDLEATIYYSADDSIKTEMSTKQAYLYGNAKIKYQDIDITAEEIRISWEDNTVFAKGRVDSTGKYIGRPVFVQAGEIMVMDSVKSNTKTKKALIYGIETKQGEGYLTGDIAKRKEDAIYLREGHYTTCNLKHPHFYINARKLKVIPNDKAVCGPFNLTIEDVPTPIGFFLGYFPMSNKRKSGLIFPQLGEDVSRGFYMTQGGYYWAVNDYVGIRTVADLYANGSYRINNTINYIHRYRFNGNTALDLSRVKSGFDNEKPPRQFSFNWNHNSKQRKNSSFRANVRVSSDKYNQTVGFDPVIRNTNASSSGITYNKQFGRSPFNMSAGVVGDQNVNSTSSNSTEPQAAYNLKPQVSLNMVQQYPFKRKVSSGNKWYERISIGYTAAANYTLSNKVKYVPDSRYPTAFRDSIYEVNPYNLQNIILPNGLWNASHRIPINASFKILKNISLNPSFNYNEYWYQKRLTWRYDEVNRRGAVTDTTIGFFRAGSYNANIGLTTNVYGMYSLRSKVVQKIRHTLTPNVGMSFAPDFSNYDAWTKMEEVRTSNGEAERYFRYLGTATPRGEQAALGFGVNNAIEAKVRNRRDSTGTGTKKVKLLDNLRIESRYNFAADSLKLSSFTVSAATVLFNRLNISYNAILDPYRYVLDSSTVLSNGETQNYQRRVNQFRIDYKEGLYKTESYNIAMGLNLTPPKKKTAKPVTTSEDEETMLDHARNNPDQYVDFTMPWTLNLSYGYYYNKVGFDKARKRQSLSLNGDLSLTEKWKLGVSTSYDFEEKSISTTQMSINRDLHCWQMSFTASPYGAYKYYLFTIQAKSSILQQLKLNKRSQGFNSPY